MVYNHKLHSYLDICAVLILFTLALSSCNLKKMQNTFNPLNQRLSELNKSNIDYYLDTKFELLINSINKKDHKTIKTLFSNNIQNNRSISLDYNIQDLITFIGNKTVSWERTSYCIDEKIDKGIHILEIKSFYIVNINHVTYNCFILDYKSDKSDKNNIGIHSLRLANIEDKKNWGYWQDMTTPGIIVFE